MQIYIKPNARKEMRMAGFNILRASLIISKGERTDHPGGSLVYTHMGKTVIGSFANDRFEVFRFYNN